jgi:hypothetical protein
MRPELATLVRGVWFDMAGYTVAVNSKLVQVPKCIAVVKKASMNPDTFVMAGGAAFPNNPERAH